MENSPWVGPCQSMRVLLLGCQALVGLLSMGLAAELHTMEVLMAQIRGCALSGRGQRIKFRPWLISVHIQIAVVACVNPIAGHFWLIAGSTTLICRLHGGGRSGWKGD